MFWPTSVLFMSNSRQIFSGHTHTSGDILFLVQDRREFIHKSNNAVKTSHSLFPFRFIDPAHFVQTL